MRPSSYHGVTTALIGNCGVTFAPCGAENRRYLAELMEAVEDIAADAIIDGLPWNWTSFGEYLDTVQSLRPAPERGRLGRPLRHPLRGHGRQELRRRRAGG